MGKPTLWTGRERFREALLEWYRKNKVPYAARRKAQEEIAERIGVSQKTFRQWISGGVRPSYQNLVQLSELFGIDLASLDTVTEVTHNDIELTIKTIRCLVSTSDDQARTYVLTRCAMAFKELEVLRK